MLNGNLFDDIDNLVNNVSQMIIVHALLLCWQDRAWTGSSL